MKKIGILGGSFDPFHLGHLNIAKTVLEYNQLDHILITPAYIPPHKQRSLVANFEQRCQMIALSIKEEKGISISALDKQIGELSYTYHLLQRFREEYPKAELFFIMGEDSFREFSNWYHPKGICQLAKIIVLPRNTDNLKDLEQLANESSRLYHGEFMITPMEIIPISSTAIRSAVKSNESLVNLVDGKVERYIYEQGLYR